MHCYLRLLPSPVCYERELWTIARHLYSTEFQFAEFRGKI